MSWRFGSGTDRCRDAPTLQMPAAGPAASHNRPRGPAVLEPFDFTPQGWELPDIHRRALRQRARTPLSPSGWSSDPAAEQACGGSGPQPGPGLLDDVADDPFQLEGRAMADRASQARQVGNAAADVLEILVISLGVALEHDLERRG